MSTLYILIEPEANRTNKRVDQCAYGWQSLCLVKVSVAAHAQKDIALLPDVFRAKAAQCAVTNGGSKIAPEIGKGLKNGYTLQQSEQGGL